MRKHLIFIAATVIAVIIIGCSTYQDVTFDNIPQKYKDIWNHEFKEKEKGKAVSMIVNKDNQLCVLLSTGKLIIIDTNGNEMKR